MNGGLPHARTFENHTYQRPRAGKPTALTHAAAMVAWSGELTEKV
jgi:hypothetical protein